MYRNDLFLHRSPHFPSLLWWFYYVIAYDKCVINAKIMIFNVKLERQNNYMFLPCNQKVINVFDDIV